MAGFSFPPLFKFNLLFASLGWPFPPLCWVGLLLLVLLLFVYVRHYLLFVFCLVQIFLLCNICLVVVLCNICLVVALCNLCLLLLATLFCPPWCGCFCLFTGGVSAPGPVVELSTWMGLRQSSYSLWPCRSMQYGRQCDPPTVFGRQYIVGLWCRSTSTVEGRLHHEVYESPHGSSPSPVGSDDGCGFLTSSLDQRRFQSPLGSTPSPAVRDDGLGFMTPSVANPSGVLPLLDVRAGSAHRPPSPSVDDGSSLARSSDVRDASSSLSLSKSPTPNVNGGGSSGQPSRSGGCTERFSPFNGGESRRSMLCNDCCTREGEVLVTPRFHSLSCCEG